MRDLDRALRELAEDLHGLVTVDQAAKLGANHDALAHRVERGEWESFGRGVLRLVGAPRTWRQRLLAAILATGSSAVASKESAARLHSFAGYGTGPVVLTKTATGSYRSPAGAVHRSGLLLPSHITEVEHIPTTTPVRTAFDLLHGLTVPQAGRLLDDCLAARRFSLRAFAALVAEVGGRGVPGSAVARRLLDERGDGYVPPESELEALTLAVLAHGGLPAPERQVWVKPGREYGATGRVDFAYRSARLIIEADSQRWHSSYSRVAADHWRDNQLMADGWRVLRVTWWQLKRRPHEVVPLVRRALRSGTQSANTTSGSG
ncbi:MAG: hypothetical protein QOI95_330 [Acidimicrobiaceae bacterium]